MRVDAERASVGRSQGRRRRGRPGTMKRKTRLLVLLSFFLVAGVFSAGVFVPGVLGAGIFVGVFVVGVFVVGVLSRLVGFGFLHHAGVGLQLFLPLLLLVVTLHLGVHAQGEVAEDV